MAFFDKIGEKLTSGANAVSSGAEKVRDTARMNSEISSNRNEINKLLMQIGSAVKAKYIEAINDDEINQLAARVDELIARNQQLDESLKQLKGVRSCASCGAPLASGAAFCAECGARVDAVSNAQPVNVTPVAAHVYEAPQTPTAEQTDASEPAVEEPAPATEPKVEQEEQVKPVIEQPAQEPTQEPSAPTAVFCPSCGSREDNNAMFCSNCGTKLK